MALNLLCRSKSEVACWEQLRAGSIACVCSDGVIEMSEIPNREPPELPRVQRINFIEEQDGPPERELKIKLIALFNSAGWVRVASLGA